MRPIVNRQHCIIGLHTVAPWLDGCHEDSPSGSFANLIDGEGRRGRRSIWMLARSSSRLPVAPATTTSQDRPRSFYGLSRRFGVNHPPSIRQELRHGLYGTRAGERVWSRLDQAGVVAPS